MSPITSAIRGFFETTPKDQIGGWSGQDNVAAVQTWGVFGGIVAADSGSSVHASEHGLGLLQTSGATAGSDATLHGNSRFSGESNYHFIQKVELIDIADIRFGCGFTSAFDRLLSFDDPIAVDIFGIQFSTDRGDTTFQYSTKDGTTQNLIDSGVTATAGAFYFEVRLKAGSRIDFAIYDADFNPLDNASTTNNLPRTATSTYNYQCGLETRTTATKQIANYFGYLKMSRP